MTTILDLQAKLGSGALLDEPLAAYSTMRVGGPADLLFVASSVPAIIKAVQVAQARQVAWRVLGGASNVLVSDAGVRGLVIINQAGNLEFGADYVLQAESGASLAKLARECIGRGWAGLEWATGIPGSVGGALVGNAGAYGGEIGDNLETASILEPEGQVVEWPLERFEYGYRSSSLKQRVRGAGVQPVVLAATFRLSPQDPAELKRCSDQFLARRKQLQPPGASTGSTFKNPPGDQAGRLVDAAGLKGTRVGGAEISCLHANFIISQGGATAGDVKALIDMMQERVAQAFNINLELEIELIGDWG